MDLEKLQEQADKDLKINDTELDLESLKTPQLHNKYMKHLTKFKLLLSKAQIEYAATDVLHLHALREKLNEILERENRANLANECFKFLPFRAALDIKGWNDIDIFEH